MKNLLKSILRPTYLKITSFIILVYLIFMAANPKFINNLEMKFYDLMFHLRGPQPVGSEIVIVAIDDNSVKAIGRWPWSRREITRLVEVLQRAEAKVIGFDIIFAEKQESCEVDLLSRLQGEMKRGSWKSPELQQWILQESQVIDPDAELAEVFRKYRSAVLGYYFQGLESLQQGPGFLHLQVSKEIIKSSAYDLVRWSSAHCSPCPLVAARGVEINLPKIAEAAADSGYFNAMPDPDGAIRTVPLAISFQQNIYAPMMNVYFIIV